MFWYTGRIIHEIRWVLRSNLPKKGNQKGDVCALCSPDYSLAPSQVSSFLLQLVDIPLKPLLPMRRWCITNIRSTELVCRILGLADKLRAANSGGAPCCSPRCARFETCSVACDVVADNRFSSTRVWPHMTQRRGRQATASTPTCHRRPAPLPCLAWSLKQNFNDRFEQDMRWKG